MKKELKEQLSSLALNPIRWDCPLAPYTSFGIGGRATALIEVESAEELSGLLKCFAQNDLDWRLIGKGTNLLVADEGFVGIVLIFGKNFSKIRVLEETGERRVIVQVGAGCSLAKLLSWCSDNSFSGLEFATGIPGSLGGAVVMNAGACGGEMADVINSLHTMTSKAKEEHLGREELLLGYRSWENQKVQGEKRLVLAVELSLCKGEKEEIAGRCRDFLKQRLGKQPKGFKNAGSFFKNPPGDSAGRLIEASGLKGTMCGGAMVSQVHANFLVNGGQATAEDVLQLMEVVRQKVAKDTGIILEREVHFL